MTLAELAADVYRRLDYADNPPPSVATRIEGFINTHYTRLLSTDRMRPLRETSVPLSSVANQSEYVLGDTTVARVQRVTDLTNRYELTAKPLEWYRRVNPGGYTQGTPEVWVPKTTGYRTYTLILHPTPAGVLEYSIDVEHPVLVMQPDDQPELLPEDFHDLLSLLARTDEYEFKSDDRWATAKAQAEKRTMELRAWVDNHQPYRNTAVSESYWLTRGGGDPREPLVGPGVYPPGEGPGGPVGPTEPLPHDILSDKHSDTVPGTLMSGDLLKVNPSGLLTRLPLGLPGQILKVRMGIPEWSDPPAEVPPGSGDVIGPASSLTQQVAVFANTGGKIIKPVSATVSDAGELTVASTITLGSKISFGGIPSNPAAPALVRNGTTLEAKLADGSAFAPFRTGTLTADAVATGPVTAVSVAATGDISGATVWALDRVSSANGLYERGRGVAMGEVINVAYDPSAFIGSANMIWTVEAGDFVYMCYTLIGKHMFLSLQIHGSSVSGPLSTLLYVRVPGGFIPSHAVIGTACYIRNGTPTVMQNAYSTSTAGSPWLGIVKVTENAYVASVNTTYVYLNTLIPLQ